MSFADNMITVGLQIALQVHGTPIEYHRGNTAYRFSAIKGKQDALAKSGELVLGQAELTDWLFQLEQIGLSPDNEINLDTDYLIWPTTGERYDVSPVPGYRGWQHATPDHTWVRVHTVNVGVPTTTTSTTSTTTPAP